MEAPSKHERGDDKRTGAGKGGGAIQGKKKNRSISRGGVTPLSPTTVEQVRSQGTLGTLKTLQRKEKREVLQDPRLGKKVLCSSRMWNHPVQAAWGKAGQIKIRKTETTSPTTETDSSKRRIGEKSLRKSAAKTSLFENVSSTLQNRGGEKPKKIARIGLKIAVENSRTGKASGRGRINFGMRCYCPADRECTEAEGRSNERRGPTDAGDPQNGAPKQLTTPFELVSRNRRRRVYAKKTKRHVRESSEPKLLGAERSIRAGVRRVSILVTEGNLPTMGSSGKSQPPIKA